MHKVVATTDVLLRDVRHDRGTEFTVVEAPAAPLEVDPATAGHWVQLGWAKAALTHNKTKPAEPK